MSPNMARVVSLLGAACLLTQAAPAQAQWLPVGNPCCCCPIPCAQPVSVPCYQTVPVTEYRPVRQTVMKPVVKTQLIDQPVTEYHPVTEPRTAQIPTCTYQPVTEYIPSTRDCGCWQTYCQCNPRISPCQYDPRPGLIGWLNRTGYEFRSAMTPPVVYRRQWVPNYVTTMIPITRQVAQHSVREVTYHVTRMVPHHTTRQVAVNHVEYETAEVVTQQPVTVMKTVPIGTSVAWVPFGAATATALVPTADPNFSSRAKAYEDSKRFERKVEKAERAEKAFESAHPDVEDKRSGMVVPQRKAGDPTAQQNAAYPTPSAVRLHGWTARKRAASGPQLNPSGVSLADAKP